MEVKLPAGTIGIRGTICAGLVAGLAASVLLQGPGPKNNTGDPPGKVNVGNAGEDVSLTRPGFGTRIEGPDAAPVPPFQFSREDLAQITGALGAEAPAEEEEAAEGEAGEGSASEEAGQTTVQALESVGDTQSISNLSTDLEDETNKSAQTAADTTNTVADGISTLDQLRTIETGQFNFTKTGTFTQTKKDGSPVNKVGTATVKVDVDFGARTYGGGNSKTTLDTSTAGGNISGTFVIESQPFSTGSGNAVFTDIESSTTVTTTFKNSGGTVGNRADFEITYDDGGSNRANGTLSDVARSSGLSS
jgi:hypothetical protein